MAPTLNPSATVRLPARSQGKQSDLYRGEALDPQFVADLTPEYKEFTSQAFKTISEEYDSVIKGTKTLAALLKELNVTAFEVGYGGRSNLEDRAVPGQYRYEYDSKSSLRNVWVTIRPEELFSKERNYPIDTTVDYDFIHLNADEIAYLKSRKIEPSRVSKYDVGINILRGLNPVTNIFPFGYTISDPDTKSSRFCYANANEIPNLISYASTLMLKLDKIQPLTKAELQNFISSRENNKHAYEILTEIAYIYRCLIVSHPFLTINNSLIMILINYLLSKKGFYQIPHLRFEYEVSLLEINDFKDHFMNMVREYMLGEWD